MEDKEIDDLVIEREKSRFQKATRLLKFGNFIERIAHQRRKYELKRIEKRRLELEARGRNKEEKRRIARFAIKNSSKKK